MGCADVGGTFPDLGERSPEIGEASPDVGEMSPNVREAFPEMGETSPNVREAFPDVGETFPKMREMFPHVGEVSPALRRACPAVIEAYGEHDALRDMCRAVAPARRGDYLLFCGKRQLHIEHGDSLICFYACSAAFT